MANRPHPTPKCVILTRKNRVFLLQLLNILEKRRFAWIKLDERSFFYEKEVKICI